MLEGLNLIREFWRVLRRRVASHVATRSMLSSQPRVNRDFNERISGLANPPREFEDAIQNGKENLKILQLAAAWCRNADYTKGPFGTGLLEVSTGLPISGGSLRCDFADAPSVFAHNLRDTALDFYESNCVGCTHRVQTGVTEHLGNWANARISARKRDLIRIEEERRAAIEARNTRATRRRFLLGERNASTQSILNLLDRVDSSKRDQEAEHLLVTHASMAPGDFSDGLVEHVVEEAMAIGNSAFLEVAIAIFERQRRPSREQMVGVAFQALREEVAVKAAGRVIAIHATEFDIDPEPLMNIVKLAAGEPDHFRARRVDPDPAALFRFCDCDPAAATDLMSALLDDPDDQTRAYAAHASEKLVAARPSVRPALLTALLNALRFPDESMYLGDPYAAAQIARVVGDILVSDPASTDRKIGARMKRADPELAKRLWRCYDSLAPSQFRDPAPKEVMFTAIERSILLLELDGNRDLAREVADSLTSFCREIKHDPPTLIPRLVRLVALWAERLQSLNAVEPSTDDADFLSALNIQSEIALISSVIYELRESLESCATRDPSAYVDFVESSWVTKESGIAREWLIDALQVVVRDPMGIDAALRVLTRSLASQDNRERAAALRVVGAIRSPVSELPQDVSAHVLKALNGDEDVMVLIAAIRAAWNIQIPAGGLPTGHRHIAQFHSGLRPKRNVQGRRSWGDRIRHETGERAALRKKVGS